jgi:hypothetical protein
MFELIVHKTDFPAFDLSEEKRILQQNIQELR